MLIRAFVPHGHAAIVALGHVHRDIGATKQRRSLDAMPGKHCDADAGRNVDDMTLKRHRQLERAQDRSREMLCFRDFSSG